MPLDNDQYQQEIAKVEDMSMEERSIYVTDVLGNPPPDSEPGWYIVVDYPREANGEERMVWKRSLHKVITPESCSTP